MSDRGADRSRNSVVGYARPPAEHRFQKGVSGNPKGRPKGAKAKPKTQYDPAMRPTDQLVLEEAYRPVTIREGDTVIELPAIQAAMRALAISAMKGSRLSQKALAEITSTAEARASEERLTMMENALEYKQRWTAEIERCRRLSIEIPSPIPHPDDIQIDMRSGKVRTEGPLDEREKRDWDKRIARREDAQLEINDYARRIKRAKSDRMRELYQAMWISEQYIFDLINDGMPDRYQVKLENRSWHADASREGKAAEMFSKMRAARS